MSSRMKNWLKVRLIAGFFVTVPAVATAWILWVFWSAIDGFREFLRRYPEHVQANSAQYWIGEGYAALAQQYANAGQTERATEALQRAVQEFRKVVANYPRGDRTPTALYKEALTLVELKQPALAQARLQYLVDNFPQAEETPLARERLASLRQR